MWFILQSSEKLNHIFCSTVCIHSNRAGLMSEMKNAECVVNSILGSGHFKALFYGFFLMTNCGDILFVL